MPKKSLAKKKNTKKKSDTHNWLSHYFIERDKFFHDHQSSRILLGVFLVSFAYFIATLIANYKKEIYIGQQLDAYGIDAVKVNALEK